MINLSTYLIIACMQKNVTSCRKKRKRKQFLIFYTTFVGCRESESSKNESESRKQRFCVICQSNDAPLFKSTVKHEYVQMRKLTAAK